MAMERTVVNPWEWSQAMGYNQGEVVSGHTRTLYCSGQTAMGSDGKPQHAGDMAAQVAMRMTSARESGNARARDSPPTIRTATSLRSSTTWILNRSSRRSTTGG